MKTEKTHVNIRYEYLTPRIEESMREIVKGSLLDDFSYASTSGSLVFGGAIRGQSDIDLMVVLKNSFSTKTKSVRDSKIKSLIDGYLKLHQDNNLMPDTVFPGEYITDDQVTDAIAGRGYHIDIYNKLFLPQASEKYYLEDSERWYRAWFSMTAYGEYIVGDRKTFEQNKLKAWNTLILFNSYDLTSSTNASGIIDRLSAPANKWAGSGISERYYTFRQHELSYAERALIALSEAGYFFFNDGRFTPNEEQIHKWHADKVIQIRDKSIRKASFLVNLKEAKQFAKYADHKWKDISKK